MRFQAQPPIAPLLERITDLEPLLRAHRDENERQGRLVEPVVAALRDAGLYRLGVPEHYGGMQLHPLEIFEIVEALAMTDSVVGWNVGLASVNDTLLGLFGPDVADEVYADGPDTVVASGTFPPLSVVTGGDGSIVEGELHFLSGAYQASWFVGFAMRISDGELVTAPDGDLPLPHLVCLSRDEVEVLDRWNVFAMRGTGSTDVRVDRARVPDSRITGLTEFRPAGHFDWPEYQLAPFNGPLYESAVSVGIALAAIAELVNLAAVKARAMDMETLRHRERTQHNLGRATALTEGARAYMLNSVRRAGESDGDSAATKCSLQLSFCQAAANAADAIDLVCEAAGTSSGRLEHRFERHFRDVHFLKKHATKSVDRYASVGRLKLGMPAGWPLLDL